MVIDKGYFVVAGAMANLLTEANWDRQKVDKREVVRGTPLPAS